MLCSVLKAVRDAGRMLTLSMKHNNTTLVCSCLDLPVPHVYTTRTIPSAGTLLYGIKTCVLCRYQPERRYVKLLPSTHINIALPTTANLPELHEDAYSSRGTSVWHQSGISLA